MEVKEPTQKQELHVARIAQVCQISEDLTLQILKLINKAIVSTRNFRGQSRLICFYVGSLHQRAKDESDNRLEVAKQRDYYVYK